MVCAYYADSGYFHVSVVLPADKLAGSKFVEPLTAVDDAVLSEHAPERVLHFTLLENLTAHAGALAAVPAIQKATGSRNRAKATAAGNYSSFGSSQAGVPGDV